MMNDCFLPWFPKVQYTFSWGLLLALAERSATKYTGNVPWKPLWSSTRTMSSGCMGESPSPRDPR